MPLHPDDGNLAALAAHERATDPVLIAIARPRRPADEDRPFIWESDEVIVEDEVTA